MSQNGKAKKNILKVEADSMRWFTFGTEEEAFEADVIQLYNDWCAAKEPLLDAEGQVPKGALRQLADVNVEWVKSVLNRLSEDHPYKQSGVMPVLSDGQVNRFITMMCDEVEELSAFFQPKSGAARSSRGSTEVRYSTDPTPS